MGVMNKVNAVMVSIVLLSTANISYAVPMNSVIMACQLTNNKVVGIWIEHGALNYVYGDSNTQMGDQEMQMTSNEDNSYTYQDQGIHSIARYIRFVKDDYNYVVYSVLDGADYTNQGVAVFKGSKRIMNKKCNSDMRISDNVDFNNLSDYNVSTDTEDNADKIFIGIQ